MDLICRTGRIPFASETETRRAVEAVRLQGVPGRIAVRRCGHCGLWHFGLAAPLRPVGIPALRLARPDRGRWD